MPSPTLLRRELSDCAGARLPFQALQRRHQGEPAQGETRLRVLSVTQLFTQDCNMFKLGFCIHGSYWCVFTAVCEV